MNKYDDMSIEELRELREKMTAEIRELIEKNDMIVGGLIAALTQSNEALEKGSRDNLPSRD